MVCLKTHKGDFCPWCKIEELNLEIQRRDVGLRLIEKEAFGGYPPLLELDERVDKVVEQVKRLRVALNNSANTFEKMERMYSRGKPPV